MIPAITPNRSSLQGLNLIRISLFLTGAASMSPPNDESRVVFDISVRGEQVGLLEATVAEIGLPLTLAEARSVQGTENGYRLPGHIIAALDRVIARDGNPLWLAFPQSACYLPIVPWESLLEDWLNVPILRLSYTGVQPIISTQSLDIIVCFSFPVAKQLWAPEQIIDYFFNHIPSNIGRCTTFHVFADVGVQPFLRNIPGRHPECKIQIYDPQQAAHYEVPQLDSNPSDSTTDLESPWLLWIRDAMGTRSADLVHFFCHGYLGREDGFLCFSQSPLRNDDERYARFVGVRQICTFLDQVGAWSVAFSSQPANYSIAGLRLLHDQMAAIRPGPVLYHDMQHDPSCQALRDAYQYAYALEEAPPPSSGAISLYCHPDWAMPTTSPDDQSQRLVNELTLAGRMPDVFERVENTPSWIASGQRALERSVAQLISSAPAESGELLQSGTANALRFVSDVLQRHATKFGVGGKEKV